MFVFFFNDTATTEIYTLSLHDALPISGEAGALRWDVGTWKTTGSPSAPLGLRAVWGSGPSDVWVAGKDGVTARWDGTSDRKSTRLNSSHSQISYAVFCLKKKNSTYRDRITRAPVLMTVPALMFFVLPLLLLVMFLVFSPLMGTLSRL